MSKVICTRPLQPAADAGEQTAHRLPVLKFLPIYISHQLLLESFEWFAHQGIQAYTLKRCLNNALLEGNDPLNDTKA